MFNPRVNTTLHNKKILNILVTTIKKKIYILVTFEVFNVHFICWWGLPLATSSNFLNKLFSVLCRNVFEQFSANLINFRFAIAKISRVYCTKSLLSIKKKL